MQPNLFLQYFYTSDILSLLCSSPPADFLLQRRKQCVKARTCKSCRSCYPPTRSFRLTSSGDDEPSTEALLMNLQVSRTVHVTDCPSRASSAPSVATCRRCDCKLPLFLQTPSERAARRPRFRHSARVFEPRLLVSDSHFSAANNQRLAYKSDVALQSFGGKVVRSGPLVVKNRAGADRIVVQEAHCSVAEHDLFN